MPRRLPISLRGIASRLLRLYCALALAIFLLGWALPVAILWTAIVVLSIDAIDALIFLPLLPFLVPPYLVALLVVGLRRRRVGPFLRTSLLLFLAFAFQLAAAWEALIEPRLGALIACGGLAGLLLFGRGLLARVRRAGALERTAWLFAGLALAGLPGATLRLAIGVPEERPDPRTRLLGAFRHAQDVVVLGPSGKIAVLVRDDAVAHRIDPESGRIEASLGLPGGLQPERGVYDPGTGRLFIAGKPSAASSGEPVAVVDVDRFAVERSLATPGCVRAVSLALRGAEVVALCRGGGRLFFYDRHTLETTRSEQPDGPLFHSWELAPWSGDLAVTTTVFAYLYRFSPGNGPGSAGTWRTLRPRSMAQAVASDPLSQRLYAGLPLQRRIEVYEGNGLGPVRRLQTRGWVRELAVDPTGARLFAGDYFSGEVEMLSTETGETLDTWTVGPLLEGLTLDPAHGRLYTASNTGIRRIDLPPPAGAAAPERPARQRRYAPPRGGAGRSGRSFSTRSGRSPARSTRSARSSSSRYSSTRSP